MAHFLRREKVEKQRKEDLFRNTFCLCFSPGVAEKEIVRRGEYLVLVMSKWMYDRIAHHVYSSFTLRGHHIIRK